MSSSDFENLGRGKRVSKVTEGKKQWDADLSDLEDNRIKRRRNKLVRNEDAVLAAEELELEQMQKALNEKAKKLKLARQAAAENDDQSSPVNNTGGLFPIDEEEARNFNEILADEKRAQELINLIHQRDNVSTSTLQTMDLPELELMWTQGEPSNKSVTKPAVKLVKPVAKPAAKAPHKVSGKAAVAEWAPNQNKLGVHSVPKTPASKIRVTPDYGDLGITALGSPHQALVVAKQHARNVSMGTVPTKRASEQNSVPAKRIRTEGSQSSAPIIQGLVPESQHPRTNSSAASRSASSVRTHADSHEEAEMQEDGDEKLGGSGKEISTGDQGKGDDAEATKGGKPKPKKKDRVKNGNYTGLERQALDYTYELTLAGLGTAGFISQADDYDLRLRQSWDAALPELKLDPAVYSPMTQNHKTCVCIRINSARSRARDFCRSAIVAEFGLQCSEENPTENVKATATALLPEEWHKFVIPRSKAPPHYHAVILQQLLTLIFFTGNRAPGIVHRYMYDPMPIGAIAYAASMGDHILGRYSEYGVYKPIEEKGDGDADDQPLTTSEKRARAAKNKLALAKCLLERTVFHVGKLEEIKRRFPNATAALQSNMFKYAMESVGRQTTIVKEIAEVKKVEQDDDLAGYSDISDEKLLKVQRGARRASMAVAEVSVVPGAEIEPDDANDSDVPHPGPVPASPILSDDDDNLAPVSEPQVHSKPRRVSSILAADNDNSALVPQVQVRPQRRPTSPVSPRNNASSTLAFNVQTNPPSFVVIGGKRYYLMEPDNTSLDLSAPRRSSHKQKVHAELQSSDEESSALPAPRRASPARRHSSQKRHMRIDSDDSDHSSQAALVLSTKAGTQEHERTVERMPRDDLDEFDDTNAGQLDYNFDKTLVVHESDGHVGHIESKNNERPEQEHELKIRLKVNEELGEEDDEPASVMDGIACSPSIAPVAKQGARSGCFGASQELDSDLSDAPASPTKPALPPAAASTTDSRDNMTWQQHAVAARVAVVEKSKQAAAERKKEAARKRAETKAAKKAAMANQQGSAEPKTTRLRAKANAAGRVA